MMPLRGPDQGFESSFFSIFLIFLLWNDPIMDLTDPFPRYYTSARSTSGAPSVR